MVGELTQHIYTSTKIKQYWSHSWLAREAEALLSQGQPQPFAMLLPLVLSAPLLSQVGSLTWLSAAQPADPTHCGDR